MYENAEEAQEEVQRLNLALEEERNNNEQLQNRLAELLSQHAQEDVICISSAPQLTTSKPPSKAIIPQTAAMTDSEAIIPETAAMVSQHARDQDWLEASLAAGQQERSAVEQRLMAQAAKVQELEEHLAAERAERENLEKSMTELQNVSLQSENVLAAEREEKEQVMRTLEETREQLHLQQYGSKQQQEVREEGGEY